ncbi:U3 small nucleolar RNA-associated protein 18-like protein, partial [Stegodyphus mimosarum]
MKKKGGKKIRNLEDKEKQQVTKRKDDALESSDKISEGKKRKFPSNSELLRSDIKGLHKKKKQVVSNLQELHQILGAVKCPDEKEKELQEFVFGYDSDDLEELEEAQKEEVKEPEIWKPKWKDEDDEKILVKEKAETLKNCHRSVYLRGDEKYSDFVQEKFKKLIGEPKWAKLGRKDEDTGYESPDELLQKTGNFIQSSEFLPKGIIKIRKCSSLVDPNLKLAIVKSVEFHPTSKVALVGATNGTVNLFQIDGKINAKIQSVHFEKFPVHTAHFTVDGNEIVVGSNKFGHYFGYDMISGKIIRIPMEKGMEQQNIRRFHMSPDGKYIVVHGRYGNIHLVTAKTKEWVGSLKMNGEVIAVTFNKDGSKLYSHGDTGEVYVWDMSSRKCIYKFNDEGCIAGTSLALSPNDQFLATGSDSGVVNIYDNSSLLSTSDPKPMKVIMNLTTEVTNMKFNCTSELLALSSSHKLQAVKLVHFPSMTVFSNFPLKEDLRYPNALDISLNSGYLSVGNNVGTTYIFRLKHYKNY